MNNDDSWFEKYFANLQQKRLQQNTTIKNNDGFQDVNISNHLNQRLMQQMNQPSDRVCTLLPGSKFYRPINTMAWPTKYPVCREGGTVPDNGQVFELKGEKRVVCLQNNEVVDFSKINENSPNVTLLVEVSAPFIGTVLVEKHAVQGNSAEHGKKGMLLG